MGYYLQWHIKLCAVRTITYKTSFRQGYVTQIMSQLCYRVIIIGIQPLGRSGQRSELSQATGKALVRCILGKFLGVVCHCFPPRLDVPTFATRCLHVRHDVRDPSGGSGNCGRECCPVILTKWRLPRHLGIFYMPQIYDRILYIYIYIYTCVVWRRGYVLRNASLGEFVVVRTCADTSLDSITYYTSAKWYSLSLLGYKRVQHVTVLNTVGSCNTMVSIIRL